MTTTTDPRILPAPCVIFGVPFHNVTFREAVDWVEQRVRDRRSACIATANLDFLAHAWKDPELQRILIEADLVIADGWPIVSASRFFRPPLKERVTGSDLTPMLAERAAQTGMSLFCLGGAEGAAKEAARVLQTRYPGLNVAGTLCPPYAPLLEMDHPAILRELERTRPDILLTAFGAPKQEKWINMFVRKWRVPVAIGIGGTLDFLAGRQQRAPRWAQQLKLEWLCRMLSNPRRLCRRYAEDLAFLFRASARLTAARLQSGTIKNSAAEKWTHRSGTTGCRLDPLKEAPAAEHFLADWMPKATQGSLVMDLHHRSWLGSMELGVLLELAKACRSNGHRLILFQPHSRLLAQLEACRLNAYLDIAASVEAVDALLTELETLHHGTAENKNGSLFLRLPQELTASTLDGFKQTVQPLLDCETGSLHVDAARLDFLDSAAIGWLTSLKRICQERTIPFQCTGFHGKALQILKAARIDQLLTTECSARKNDR